jgi:GTPase SAR1 family protein
MFNTDIDLFNVGQGITNRWLEQHGYNVAQTGHTVSLSKVDDFIAALQLEGFGVCDFRNFNNVIMALSADKTIYIRLSFRFYTDIYTNTGDNTNILAFYNRYKHYFTESIEEDDEVSIEYYYNDIRSGTRSSTININKKDIQKTYPELYPDINVDELVRQYLASSDSILLLYGPPGVGKTQFIRYLLSKGDFKDIVYVKDQKVLQASDFWAGMSQNSSDLMIFDDMDAGLKPRTQQDGSSFTSNLLSFSCGIFERKIKVIITTNQPIEEIDAAIVRPGRCFDFLTLHPLTYDQAKIVWVNILKQPQTDFERLYAGQKTITQASLMSDYNREKNSFTERSYVKSGDKNYNVQSKLQANGVNVK